MRLRRTTRIVATLLMSAVAWPAVVAHASDPDGSTVIPSFTGVTGQVMVVGASADAVAFRTTDPSLPAVPGDSYVVGGKDPVALAWNEHVLSLVGDQLVTQARAGGSLYTFAIDVTSSTRTLLAVESITTPTDTVLTGTGNGWIARTVTAETHPSRLQLHVGAATHDLMTIPAGAPPIRVVADSSGALVDFRTSSPELVDYVDFATADGTGAGITTVPDVYPAGYLGQTPLALSPHDFAYLGASSDEVVRRSRASGALVANGGGFGARIIAITDDATAVDRQSPQSFSLTVAPAAFPYAETSIALPVGYPRWVAAAGDHFVTLGGSTADDTGIYSFRLGSDAVDLVAPTRLTVEAPTAVALSAGRIGQLDPKDYSPGVPAATVVGLTTSNGSVAAVGTPLIAAPGTAIALSGSRVATLGDYSTTCAADFSGSRFAFSSSYQVQLNSGETCSGLQISGSRILFAMTAPSQLAAGRDELVDPLSAEIAEPAGSALWGSRLASPSPDGTTMTVRNLDSNATTSFPAPVCGAGCTRIEKVLLHGDWVAWTSVQSDGERDLWAAHITATTTVDRGLRIATNVGAIALADGLAAYVPAAALGGTSPMQLHEVDLTGAAARDVVIGSAAPGISDAQLAISDEAVAVVEPDHRTHVLPNPMTADAGPRLLGPIRPPISFPPPFGTTPTTPLPFSTTVDASRPVSWTLTVSDAHGTPVRRVTGAAPDGEIAAAWDGKTDAGGTAAAGYYTWTLSGVGPGGALRGTVGNSDGLSGTAHISDPSQPYTGPTRPDISAPARASDVGSDGTFLVRWWAGDADSYDVAVGVGHNDAHGATHWSSPAAWKRGTKEESATIDYRSIANAVPGTRLWLRVISRLGGYGSNGPYMDAVVSIPHPMSGSAVQVHGWRSRDDAHGWLGRSLVTSAASARVAITGAGGSVTLIGRRAPGGGSFGVFVDGHRAATVRTDATQVTDRAVLLQLRLKRGITHHIELRTPSSQHRSVSLAGYLFS